MTATKALRNNQAKRSLNSAHKFHPHPAHQSTKFSLLLEGSLPILCSSKLWCTSSSVGQLTKLHATPPSQGLHSCSEFFNPSAIFNSFTLCPPTRSPASPPSSGKPTHLHMALLTGPRAPASDSDCSASLAGAPRPASRTAHPAARATPARLGPCARCSTPLCSALAHGPHFFTASSNCSLNESSTLLGTCCPQHHVSRPGLGTVQSPHTSHARAPLPASSRVTARTRHRPVPVHQPTMIAQSHETCHAAPCPHCGVEHNRNSVRTTVVPCR